jgi:hypothetical protein
MDRDYDIGYKKPPTSTRFQKGESGNKAGRPKGAKGLGTLVEMMLNETRPISLNGRTRNASNLEVSLRQLINKAVQGDLKALQQLIQLIRDVESKKAQQESIPALTEADREFLRLVPDLYGLPEDDEDPSKK